MSYKSMRRQWVKLWVNEWLDGTTRFELTSQQRLLWIDLLALAGRSRFPGFIYAGTGQGNERVGYPIAYLAGVLQMDELGTNNALKLLADHGHITLEEVSPEKYVIGIVNWEKYQSEYLRQKAYRKVTTKTTSKLQKPLLTEGEVDGEEEVDVEGEKTTTKQQSFELSESQVDKWSNFFCGLNVPNEVQKAKGWLEANPEKAAKKKNLKRFYFNWLSKAHSQRLDAEVAANVRENARYVEQHREAHIGQGPR